MSSIPTGKRLALLFFDAGTREGSTWKCDSCTKYIKQAHAGYSNLCAHINSKHDDEVSERYEKSKVKTANLFRSLTYDNKTLRVNAWLECVVHSIFPFSFVENEHVRKHLKYTGISRNTLHKYMHELLRVVELEVKETLPKHFAVIFDGWKTGDSHYVAVFATYPSRNEKGYEIVHLVCSPMEDETTQNADQHYEFLSYVLSVYGKSLQDVCAITADNCSTNRSMARRIGPIFVGCSSHRFNLAVSDVIDNHAESISQVKLLMKKLSFSIPSAKLRAFTNLKAKQCIDTRWSSTYELLRRFQEILSFIRSVDDDDVQDLIPGRSSISYIEVICEKLKDFDSVTKELQSESITIHDARILFDAIIARHSSAIQRLGPSARIVENSTFESAIVKIQGGQQHNLNAQEKRSVSHLKHPVQSGTQCEIDQGSGLSFAQQVLKRVKRTGMEVTSVYNDLRFIQPTSNSCERLFSLAGFAMGDRRHRLLPSNFECQLFLNVNRRFGGLKEVSEVIHKDT